MLIYTPKITKRLKYIFKLIFKELLNTEVTFINSADEFRNYEGQKINYSQQAFGDELFFYSHHLLYESGIKEQNLIFIDYENSKAFFSNYDKRSAMPFDAFAASFFLVSRYEEYLPYIKDKYDRFDAKESVAHKHHFLQKPLINIWALKILDIIKTHYPDFKHKHNNYKYQPTIDIDLFYAYKLKGLVRTIGGYLKSLSEKDYQGITERTRVLLGKQKDPFDTYDFQIELHNKYHLRPIYFILVADYAQYDKNISYQNREFQSLIRSLDDYAEIGIHPSFASNTNPDKLRVELQRLSKILNKDITKSRQHFLMLNLPATYRNLINLDITDDYSMGYPSEIGFRASISNSFLFYDLDLEMETNLRVHPFAVMEGTLKDYRNISNKDATEYVKPVINEIKKVNGEFISIWHNESLSNEKRWVGWNDVYEQIIKQAMNNEQ